jgi:peptidyl-prolyl cis-trans isomerase-like 3
MIQGGDPTGTGKGGQSIWGRPFNDEIRQTLKVYSISDPRQAADD